MRNTQLVNELEHDTTTGMHINCIPVEEHKALMSLTVDQLLMLVPDPTITLKKKVQYDPRIAEYAQIRSYVQRAFEGAKKKNAPSFKRYIQEGTRGFIPLALPPITLWSAEELDVLTFSNGRKAVVVPYNAALVAIDGETQRYAWQLAAQEHPDLRKHNVSVVLYHGIPREAAGQIFHDLNTKEVKPNAAVSVNMDTQDPATKIARRLIDNTPALKGRVNYQSRQLGKKEQNVVVLSALRTGIVTTLLGQPGLSIGTRSVIEALPKDFDLEEVLPKIGNIWTTILEMLEPQLLPETRGDSVVPYPAIMAGLGVVAHKILSEGLWEGEDLRKRLIKALEGINWSRKFESDGEVIYPWAGIAGKVSQSGRFSLGGPKEVGHNVVKALLESSSQMGKQIRRFQ